MSKVYLGVIFTLSLLLVFGFWRYSSALESLGELEQANKQLVSTVSSSEKQKKHLIKQQKQDGELSSRHHEKALQILSAEMRAADVLHVYKMGKLKRELNKYKLEVSHLKSGSVKLINTSKELVNEKTSKEISEKCAELPIPEFYLKQL